MMLQLNGVTCCASGHLGLWATSLSAAWWLLCSCVRGAYDKELQLPQQTALKRPVWGSCSLPCAGRTALSSWLWLRGRSSWREGQHTPCLSAAFLTQTVCLDDTTVKFEIWDTAGQERYHSLAPMYYRGAQAAIVVYDITNTVSTGEGSGCYWAVFAGASRFHGRALGFRVSAGIEFLKLTASSSV